MAHNARFVTLHALRCRLTIILSRMCPKFILSSWDLPVYLHLSLLWNWWVILLILTLNFGILPQYILFISFVDFLIIIEVIDFLENYFAVLFLSLSVGIVDMVTNSRCLFGLWFRLFPAVFNLLVLKGRLQLFRLWIYFLYRLNVMTLQGAESSIICLHVRLINWRCNNSVNISWCDLILIRIIGGFLGTSAESWLFTWCWWAKVSEIWVALILERWIFIFITG